MTSILEAQRNMREAYYAGAPGIISSGTAWLLAAVVVMTESPRAGILTLIFGGTVIFPVSVLFCKIIGCSGKHDKANPLAPLAIEGTIWMLLSIPIAVGAAFFKVEWFFPAMLLVIGGRYLTFSTLYGYASLLAFRYCSCCYGRCSSGERCSSIFRALSGALVEYIFGVVIFITYKEHQPSTALGSQA